MQGLPPKTLEDYLPLPPHSLEDSPEQRAVQDKVTSQVESSNTLEDLCIISNSLEAFWLPPTPLPYSGYERHILQMNSSGELVLETFGISIGPHSWPGVRDPLWTIDIFGHQPRIVRDLYDNLREGPDFTDVSQFPETYVTYTIPLEHFVGTIINNIVSQDTWSVGPSSNLSLQMAHSTMVPHVMTIPTGNVVVNQSPIGTPLSSRPIPSLLPRYHTLNPSTAIPTQVPSGDSRIFFQPGYNVATGFFPLPSQVLSRGSYPPFLWGYGPSGSNLVGGTSHSFTYGYQIPVGGQPQSWEQPKFGVKLKLGHNLKLDGNLRWEPITHCMDRTHLDNYPNFGTFFPKEIHNPQGENIFKLTLLYPLTLANCIQVLWIPLGVWAFTLVFLFKGTSLINPTLWDICLQILHNRVCHDCLIICRLRTVLQVYLWDSLLKITNFHNWTNSFLSWPLWIYLICLGF